MSRPTKRQIAAAADVLARRWDTHGEKAAGLAGAYEEWGAGIADVIIHAPVLESLIEYLSILEEQLGLTSSSLGERARWASQFDAAVRIAG